MIGINLVFTSQDDIYFHFLPLLAALLPCSSFVERHSIQILEMYSSCVWHFGHGHIIANGMIGPQYGMLIVIPHSCCDLPVLEADS